MHRSKPDSFDERLANVLAEMVTDEDLKRMVLTIYRAALKGDLEACAWIFDTYAWAVAGEAPHHG